MCMDPMTAAALVATIGGAKMQYDAQSNAVRRQAAAEQDALDQQDQARQRNQALVMQGAQQYDATAREQALGAQQQASTDKLQAAVQANAAPQFQNPAVAGTVSSSFTALQGQRLVEAMKRAADQARLMGATQGFDNLRRQEAANDAETGIQTGLNSAIARGQYEAAQPRIANAGRVNQGQMLAGALLQMYGAGKVFGTPTMPAQPGGTVSGPGLRAPTGMKLFATGG